MNLIEEKISKLCEEVATESGYFVIAIQFRGQKSQKIIELFIDGEKNLTIADCASISRLINEKIEAEHLIESSYRLDVSSPGVERPLKFFQQYKKHVGRKFEIEYSGEAGTVNKLTAQLNRIEDDVLIFTNKKDEIKIQFSNIIKAQVLISFS